MAQTTDMTYNFLSKNCGLKVSAICLGAMTFGENKESRLKLPKQANEELSHEIMDKFVEMGGNFIDTANAYNAGTSEQIIGNWMKKRENRDNVVIATKGFHPVHAAATVNDTGNSRHNLVKSLEGSLERLQTSYIDLYQVHMFDNGTPLEETMSTLNDFVRSGKVRYIGASNFSGWQLQKAQMIAKQMGLSEFVSLQNQYNLLCRDCEYDSFEVCKLEGVGVIPWSPLKFGLLTDKYSNRKQMDTIEGSRQAWLAGATMIRSFLGTCFEDLKDNQDYWKLMDTLVEVGKQQDKSVTQVSLKWLTQKPQVTSVIIGAKTVKQLEENVIAGYKTWQLTPEQMTKIEEASDAFFSTPYPFQGQRRFNVDRYNH